MANIDSYEVQPRDATCMTEVNPFASVTLGAGSHPCQPVSAAPICTPEDCAQQLKVMALVSDAFIILDANGVVTSCNPQFSSWFGLPDTAVISAPLRSLQQVMARCFSSREVFEKKWQSLSDLDAMPRNEEWEIAHPQLRFLEVRHAWLPSTTSGTSPSRIILWNDITDRRSLEAALKQAHKMEALGMLAGGIAHDFNNLLMAISGNVGIALEQLAADEPDDVSSLLAVVADAARGGRELVKKLLSHARRHSTSVQTVDLREIITDVRSLLKHSISPLILVELQMPKNLWPVTVDVGSLQQVVLNLCVNAVDVMKGRPNSILTLSASHKLCLASPHASDQNKTQDYVCLQIRDNGPGIPAEVRKRIFEPFYTTKVSGEGTGLGLAVSSEIMTKLGGWIECESELEKGATFSVFIPRSSDLSVTTTTRVPTVSVKKFVGTERILVVDDDPMVRSVTSRLLRGAGYQVSAADDGQAAIEWIEDGRNVADLIILDIAMPRLSGLDAMQIIRKLHPDMPVVLCSGSLADPNAMQEARGLSPNASICKPYEVPELFGTIRRVLDERCQSQSSQGLEPVRS